MKNLGMALVAWAAAACIASAEPSNPAESLALRRGVNLSHWFSQHGDYSPRRLHARFTADDANLLRATGLDHARFALNPRLLWNYGAGADPDKLNADDLKEVDRALDLLLAAGLDVVVDIHPDEDFTARLNADPGFAQRFAAFWRALAGHLSQTDPRRVVLEALNEPGVKDPAHWNEIQGELVKVIRQAAPRHAIIVTGGAFGGVDDLRAVHPLDDPNLIYTFHMYEPFSFTHQGATWGMPQWRAMRNVPYPASPESVAKPAADISDAEARKTILWYGHEGWDAAKVAARIEAAARWGSKHHVRLYCGEFGVHRPVAPPADRVAWLRDTRTALEKFGIGWCMWDYDASFGMVRRTDQAVTVDDAVVRALGLGAAQQ